MAHNRGLMLGDLSRSLARLCHCIAFPKYIWQPIAEQLVDDSIILMDTIERLTAEQLIEHHDIYYRLRYDTHDPDDIVLSSSCVAITLRSAAHEPLHLNLGLDSKEFISPLLTQS